MFLSKMWATVQSSKSLEMIKRVYGRSAVFLFLTVLGFTLLEVLVYLARVENIDIIHRFPEVLIILRGVTILAWLEMSLMWIRMMAAPGVDVQLAARKADNEPMSAAVVYVAHTLGWAFRLFVLLKLCELL